MRGLARLVGRGRSSQKRFELSAQHNNFRFIPHLFASSPATTSFLGRHISPVFFSFHFYEMGPSRRAEEKHVHPNSVYTQPCMAASIMFYPGKPVIEVGSADFLNSHW